MWAWKRTAGSAAAFAVETFTGLGAKGFEQRVVSDEVMTRKV
jgi:hypothetical protein